MLISDPDDLEVTFFRYNFATKGNMMIDFCKKEIYLREFGKLSKDGVMLQMFYSKLREIWHDNDIANQFEFPMVAITPEMFEFIEGWNVDDETISFFRDGGFTIVDEKRTVQTGVRTYSTTVITRRDYINVISKIGKLHYMSGDISIKLTTNTSDGGINTCLPLMDGACRVFDARLPDNIEFGIGIKNGDYTYQSYRFFTWEEQREIKKIK